MKLLSSVCIGPGIGWFFYLCHFTICIWIGYKHKNSIALKKIELSVVTNVAASSDIDSESAGQYMHDISLSEMSERHESDSQYYEYYSYM